MPENTVVVKGIYRVRGTYHTQDKCPAVKSMTDPDERSLSELQNDDGWEHCKWCAGDNWAKPDRESRYSDAYRALINADADVHNGGDE